jgi:biotin synthase
VKADSGVAASKLMDVQAVLQSAAQARDAGSKRFCMGAAWRNPKDRDMGTIVQMVKGVREMGMETCMTLGMLTPAKPRNSPRRAWITTTTTSTPRPNAITR